MANHGTYARYTKDRCRCDECREAGNAYHRAYRARHPHLAAISRRQNAAYRAAMVAIRERYRAEFDAIYLDECRRHGVK